MAIDYTLIGINPEGKWENGDIYEHSKTYKIFFINKAYDILKDYKKYGNRLDLQIGHYMLPKSLTIVDIVNYKYLISKELNVYIIAFYPDYNTLGVRPLYHEYHSPILLNNHVIQYADGVLYCEFCQCVIDLEPT